ncbi:hypothetical protein BV25DRAFT_1825221 [Artomyces pyxidatus]|uniref:Uncharacterized protein n=1 Tax=Artomyces pyxidatus TaxID=48021 RepID=A0ACB8T1V0_9AGAM|nr:hypothetical protein BV25DRAFT_1825221 [Artomyces pyxidatus]
MVNWNDPAIVARDYAGLVNSVHAVGGLYIWEFFVTLDFDWDIIRGRRKYPYTFPLYLGCRLSGISAIVALFVGFDASSKIDCQVWVVFVFLLAYLSFVFASALIVLRIVAIWEKNRLITAIAVVTWLTNTAFYIHSVIVTQAAWNEDAGFCLVLHTARSRDNVLVTLATDTVLLLLTLFGLLRWRNAGMAGGIWRLLYTQGLLWIVVVTLGEVPAAVFILLNLNGEKLRTEIESSLTLMNGTVQIPSIW